MGLAIDTQTEWLEADGLGGFASGTTSTIRTRRYHALLLAAATPPTGRFVLVNGVEATLTTAAGEFPLSFQRYAPGVTTSSERVEIEAFTSDPWPRWVFRLADGMRVEHEVFAVKGAARTVMSWRLLGSAGGAAVLRVRLLISGRDYHALHHENQSFAFEPRAEGRRLVWTPYPGVPSICAEHNGAYRHEPVWYRRFEYEQERERGFECHEDLASPGVFEYDLREGAAALMLAADEAPAGAGFEELGRAERLRRAGFTSALERAGDAYLAKRGDGKTIIAGYPWFADWGRDTFIAVRGLCLATGRLEEARQVLMSWAGTDSHGVLPNRFMDDGSPPEFNSVDASLWFVIAAHELAAAAAQQGEPLSEGESTALTDAIQRILSGYAEGTHHGIRLDEDGLLAGGEPGVQLTWMDAKVGGRVITPRIGKPVEVQALWLNALRIGALWAPRWLDVLELGMRSFQERFWNEAEGCLFDVVDVDHARGACDGSVRPNQVLAAGGLPLCLLSRERARRVLDAVESRLLTPIGLRSLARGSPGYAGRYRGGPEQRDSVYHQGTVWPWLLGPFVEAWVRSRGGTPAARAEARERFLTPLLEHLNAAGIGHVSEVADGDAPHTPGGCPFQAWSVGEALRLERRVLAEPGEMGACGGLSHPQPQARRSARPLAISA
jgi:predicted glycogen debranching enzyme